MRGEMALLILSPLSSFSLSSPSSSSSLSMAVSSHPYGPRLTTADPFGIKLPPAGRQFLRKSLNLQQRSFDGVWFHTPISLQERPSLIVRASSDVDGTDPSSADTPTEASGEPVPVENLPLESKLQLKLEQKMRMKLAKKIRLRRKRLVRKRRMRKKGRWPPSKMKKNKNV